MNLVGRTISHYNFIERLGAGGMGEIYKAQDKRLNRFVAVKVLSTANAGDPDHRRRFLLEAQAASALNHPNIITIHDIVNEGDADFMVMEFVSGRTLVEFVPKGGVPVQLALKLAVQIADALSTAHAAGIVHRDLKPGNVMVTDAGLVKILDFGLAKFTGPEPLPGDDATRTIQKAPLTVEGSIIGTVSYMSPEQAQGRKVDARSDIFSFGLVFYEMLTGERAFGADSALGTLTAILRDQHRPIRELASGTPQPLEDLVTHCLKKNPDERWQSMAEVLSVLNSLKRDSETGTLWRPLAAATQPSAISAPPAPGPASAQMPPPKSNAGAKQVARLAAVLVFILLARMLFLWEQRLRHPHVPPSAASPAAAADSKSPVAVLDNDAVIAMVKARVATTVIIQEIRTSKTNFELTPAELIRLSKSKVPAAVIEVMQNPNAPVSESSAAANGAAPAAVSPPVSAPAAANPPAAPPAAPEPEKIAVAVPDSLALGMMLMEDVPTQIEEDKPVRFITTGDVKIGDAVVIAKGANVVGKVVDLISRRRLFGRDSGVRAFELGTVEAVDGSKINLRASAVRNKEGISRHMFELGGRGKTKEIQAAAGSRYVAYVDGDQSVKVRKQPSGN